ncbi:MAG: hypothetical protein Q4D33_07620 [Prevotellaceae bacterium]|nr:hypothetical protein [Prevotellaceae bacterium]
MLIEAEDKILKEFLEYKRKQEEKKAVKRPAHRPTVRLFVDDNGKELMLSCLKSVIEKYYAPLTGRIVIAGVGISKTRFWILAYVAFAAMGIIKPGNNVDTYLKIIQNNIDKQYLVHGSNVNKKIHAIIDDPLSYEMYMSISTLDQLKTTISETRLSTESKTLLHAWYLIRMVTEQKISFFQKNI